ncbi:unnamed protein product [Caretta caretta]
MAMYSKMDPPVCLGSYEQTISALSSLRLKLVHRVRIPTVGCGWRLAWLLSLAFLPGDVSCLQSLSKAV